ncbi:Uncharacterized protein PBTT_02368 [Plasmodiophora brassicae]
MLLSGRPSSRWWNRSVIVLQRSSRIAPVAALGAGLLGLVGFVAIIHHTRPQAVPGVRLPTLFEGARFRMTTSQPLSASYLLHLSSPAGVPDPTNNGIRWWNASATDEESGSTVARGIAFLRQNRPLSSVRMELWLTWLPDRGRLWTATLDSYFGCVAGDECRFMFRDDLGNHVVLIRVPTDDERRRPVSSHRERTK